MPASLNLHKLFSGRGGYLDRLKVPELDEAILRDARDKIRGTLQTAFRNWRQYVTKTDLFDGELLKSVEDPKLPQPKFRGQGSFTYGTVNDCQVNPPQQIDLDYGLFLPIGFLAGGGSTRPRIASRAYFKIVEDALAPLCRQNGWLLNPGRAKDTCVRVQISARTHIDIPLYAIKDEAFSTLAQDAMRKSLAHFAEMEARDELFDDVYRGLAATEIMLAHRSEGWIESDPRRLEDWFDAAVAAFGPQVRRLSRDFKGMRDAAWSVSDLRSICIMAAVVTAFENIGRQDESRDDLALLNIARELVEVFRYPIENPVFPGDASKYLCEGWSPEFRAQVRALFLRAANELDAAINVSMHRGVAIRHARNAFGARIPDDIDLVSSVGVAAFIRSQPPAPQPRPMPVRTNSG